ncbi:hypothetical protein OEZ86_007967 [Tetradesmus obliquus]|nr:hypothetical protein OEZ86_007967 [Tetradesmus obliquus]
MPDGTLREVPPPATRLGLIKQCHDRTGHFGIRRTTAMLLHTWWWHGLQADVAAARKPLSAPATPSCTTCSASTAQWPSAATTEARRELVKRICPEAMSNLQIAQHRDTQRYAQIRSGTYSPKHHKFECQRVTGCAPGTTIPNDAAFSRSHAR